MLSKSQLEQFHKDGYLFLGRILETKAVKLIENRIHDLTQGNIKNPKIEYQIEPKLLKKNNPLREKMDSKVLQILIENLGHSQTTILYQNI